MTTIFMHRNSRRNLVEYGKLDIFSTNQGSRFTSGDFVRLQVANQVEISIDGKRSRHDECFGRAAVTLSQVRRDP